MGRRPARIVGCLVVIAALLLGPLAMAVDACDSMGVCDVTCGAVLAAAPPMSSPLLAGTEAVTGAPPAVPPPFLATLDPPPKLALPL